MTPRETPYERILRALGDRVVTRGDQQSTARCPAHEDKRASLSIGQTDGGTLLLHCHAGCPMVDVLAALGLTTLDLYPESGRAKFEIVAEYDYRDEQGALLFQVVRLAPKGFRQRRPDGNGWAWSVHGIRRVLYRLPEIIAAPPEEPVIIVEGEKDADNGVRAGLVTSTNAGGATKWKYVDRRSIDALRGRDVILVPDNDQAGEKHIAAVAKDLAGIAKAVRVVRLPGLPAKGDLSDWLAAGGTRDEFLKLAAEAPMWGADSPASTGASAAGEPEGDGDGGGKPTQAQLLLGLVDESDADLWHAPDETSYVTVEIDDVTQTMRVRSRACRRWLTLMFFDGPGAGKPPGAQALNDAVATLDARAIRYGSEHPVFVRVAPAAEGGIEIDLGDSEWKSAVITARGVDVGPHRAKFRRPPSMAPLPRPDARGELEEVRAMLGIEDPGPWYLLAAWVTCAARPSGPYPILLLRGEQGSGKSTIARMLRRLVDPATAGELRSPPRDERDVMIAATRSQVVTIDNLSKIDDELSDTLCRMSTGAAYGTRTLYSDDDETVLAATRPVLLTSIDDVASRGDLLDRTIIVDLPTIDEGRRRPERAVTLPDGTVIPGVMDDYDAAWPRLVGGIMRTVSRALVASPKLPRALPRMADFAIWGCRVEMAEGWPPGSFLEAYCSSRDAATTAALEADSLSAIVQQLAAERGPWSGTSTEMLEALRSVAGHSDPPRWWPRSARALSGRLRRLAPDLRRIGLEITWLTSHRQGRVVQLGRRPSPASPASPASPKSGDGGDGGDGGDAKFRYCTTPDLNGERDWAEGEL